MLVIFNVLVLFALLVLLVLEEIRYRKFSSTVRETQEGLLALAHQLRSPLATLKKYHAFLRGNEFGKLSFAQQEALSKVDLAFAESVVLMERLLARSQIEDVSMTPRKSEPVDIVQSCTAAISAITPAAEKLNQHIAFATPSRRIHVQADPLLLHGILDELLLNAISYTPKNGKIMIGITTTKTTATIAIRDNGIGISDAEKKNIFHKFFRGNKARQMSDGTGLGLAFTKAFVERSGGSIRFVSQEGKGSTFSVTLRRKSA